MRQKSKVINIPIYDMDVNLIYYKDYKYANKKLARWGFTSKLDEADAGMCYMETIEDGNNTFRGVILAIRYDDRLENLKNTISHETFHLTQVILEDLGIPFKKGGANEAYTYLNSYLQSIIEKFILT